MKKKKCKHVFFKNFPVAGNNWKEGRKNNEKKMVCRIGWATAQLYCKRGRILCCTTVIVLQRFRLGGLKSVLQY